MLSKFATPERIEFENSIDFGEEETEELQNQHNLGGLSPNTADEVHFIIAYNLIGKSSYTLYSGWSLFT